MKIFFTSKFCYVLFCNPTHKTETRTANRWGTTNSKPPGPIIMMRQSETLSCSWIIFITLFFQVQSAAVPFTSYGQPAPLCCEQNHFPEPNRHVLDFLHLILLCRVTYWAPLEMVLQVLRRQRIWFTIVGEWGMNEFFLIATNHGHIPWFYFTKLSFIYDEMVLHMITITHIHCLCNACPIVCNAHLTTQSQCKMISFQICLR